MALPAVVDGDDTYMRPVCSSSSSSSFSSSSSYVQSSTRASTSTFFCAFLATLDLLSHTFTFLPFTDLLTASAISQLLHAAVDSDKVWRPRLTAALTVSALPADTPTCPPLPAGTGVAPSILTVLSVLSRHSAHVGPHRYNQLWRAAVTAPQPTVTAIVPTSQPLVYHVKWCTEQSPTHCHVDYREVEIRRLGEEAQVEDEEERQRGDNEESESGWEVKRVGPRLSGRSVLNMADNRHLLTAPKPPPKPPQSAKQRYLATFGCSVRQSTNSVRQSTNSSTTASTVCRTLLSPQPPLPAPTVPPRWFSENLRDAVANGEEAPPIPASPYPPLVVWPVCRTCRAEAAAAVQAICDEWRRLRRERPLQVDCIVRINENEWDARSREYEDEMDYRRVALTTTIQPAPLNTAASPHSPSSASSTAPAAPTSAQKSCVVASRLYQYDSGQYAISLPSNLPFTNPAPPTGPPRIHPHHDHPLRYYRVSPYRHGGYVCNVCATNTNGEVWHCERCQFDLCMECAAEWPVPEGEEGNEEKEGQVEAEVGAEEAELAMDADGVANEFEEQEQNEPDEWMSDADDTNEAAHHPPTSL